mmetsp:Transcript_19596/g.75173  ORF Transcript_19596/g.75173 Transcript_19596/m.75173 type:complete len:276 (+) Transcript_19596:447-1274(+)
MPYFSRSVMVMRSNFWPTTMPARSAPRSCMRCVEDGRIGFISARRGCDLRTASMPSSAIWRYVVHLPPITDTMPDGDVSTTWLRLKLLVSLASKSRTSGRIPDQAALTSWRDTLVLRKRFASSRMNEISCSVGLGIIVRSVSESVVPHRVEPSHGRKKRTRPSRVLGTMSPWRSGQQWSGRMMCTPPAGTIRSLASGASILRSVSANGPVALTTARARMTHDSPVCSSRTSTPHTLPSLSCLMPTTVMWLDTAAPCCAAVRAMRRFMRVSLCIPS